MGLSAKLCFYLLSIYLFESYSLLVATLIGGILYLVIIYFMRIKYVDEIITLIKTKIRRT